ncbi:MAG: sigma-70 family RNA polymerase sigma factor [Planctomycetes bacterium]|nr:sigma-70 family RNA polymerase sigma factor [Planctomycetota bacterium]
MPNSTFDGIENMRPNDYTDMGGTGGAFLTTHWSLIEDIKSKEDKNRALVGLLLSKYWKPVYCYLRRKGYDNDKAKDLTQEFFYEAVFGRGLIQKADESKGRFRSFVLIALNRFLINIKNKETAQKRIPKDKLVPLDMIDSLELPRTLSTLAPEDSFNYAWVSSLLEDVLEEVEAKCHEDDKSVHWQVFHDKVLQPIIDGTNIPSLKEICERYGIKDDAKASNMIVTVKRRFQVALKKQLRDSVVTEEQVSGELEEIKRFFPKIAQDGE